MVSHSLSTESLARWLVDSTPQDCEESVMSGLQQLMVRRMCTGIAFAMALVLTPRAWVGETTERIADNIPTQSLQIKDSCLWCEPVMENRDCADGEQQQPRIWLNPDEPAGAAQDRPCRETATEERPSA